MVVPHCASILRMCRFNVALYSCTVEISAINIRIYRAENIQLDYKSNEWYIIRSSDLWPFINWYRTQTFNISTICTVSIKFSKLLQQRKDLWGRHSKYNQLDTSAIPYYFLSHCVISQEKVSINIIWKSYSPAGWYTHKSNQPRAYVPPICTTTFTIHAYTLSSLTFTLITQIWWRERSIGGS